MKNYNEIEVEDFVNREVLQNMSMLIEDMDNKGMIEPEEVENLYEYRCPNCGHGETDFQKFETIFIDEKEHFVCPSCNYKFETDIDMEPKEIYEWYLVSNWLYERLKQNDEVVYAYNDYNYFWGRTCTGQAICLDSVIKKIYKETMK